MASRALLSTLRTKGAHAAKRRVRIDTRSLAAFRIALGMLLLLDLLLRSRDLVAHYTDRGVLPRVALHRFSQPHEFSIYYSSGEAWVVALLFVIAGIFAVALILGYRTTVVTVICWVLLISLHNRNPVVLNGGDNLLRMVLFWSMFLPLGARWSVDAVRSEDEEKTHVASLASFALLFQVVFMYTVNGILKLHGDLWLSGEAIRYVFSLDQFTVLLGDALANYPLLLIAFDRLWLVMVVGSVLLILLTGFWRAGLAVLFMGMHLGMLLTMQLGLFPLIAIAALLTFLPAHVWDRVLPRARDTRLGAMAGWPQQAAATLPTSSIVEIPRMLRRVADRLRPVVVVAFLVLILVWHLQMGGLVTMPDAANDAVETTRVDQYWTMFAPNPLQIDGWYVVPAELENGSQVDAFHGGPVQWDRPEDLASTYPNARWRKYLVNLWRPGYSEHRKYFAEYLCGRWNQNHETDITELTIYYMEQPSRPYAQQEPINKVELWHHNCGWELS